MLRLQYSILDRCHISYLDIAGLFRLKLNDRLTSTTELELVLWPKPGDDYDCQRLINAV